MDKALKKVKEAGYRPLMWKTYDSEIDGSRFYGFFSERNGSYFLMISDETEMPAWQACFPDTRMTVLKPGNKFKGSIIMRLKKIYGYEEIQAR